MTVSFTLHQASTIVAGDLPLYRVTKEVTAAVGASPAVFVYKTASQEYSHIAALADIEQYPDSYESAVLDSKMFYRLTTVTRDWDEVFMADADLEITPPRLQLLANDLNRTQGAFVSDTTTVITGV